MDDGGLTVAPDQVADSAASRWMFGLTLAVVLVVGSVLRVGALGMHSFWYDEVVAMRVARAPSLVEFADRLARMDKVGAPLHPFLQRYWTAALGNSEGAARGLSAAFSILGLCVLAATAWQAFRSRGATVAAAAVFAVCPLDLLYAMENRMYSLLAFLTIASWGLLFSFRRGRSLTRESAFGACLIGLAYTHPLGGLMIVALGLGYLIDVERSMLRPARWLAIQVLVFAAILPWTGRYLDHPPDPKLGFNSPSIVVNWAAYGLAWPVRSLPVLLGVVASAWLAPARRFERARGVAERVDRSVRLRTGLMLCVWVALPLGAMIAYTYLRYPILGPIRYQVFLMPGLVLLIAGAARFRPLTAGGVVAALVLVFTLPALRTEVYNPQRKPEWREAARAMLRRSPNPIVVLAAREPHMYYHTIDYYLPAAAPVISLSTYMEQRGAGTLDRTRDYWLFHDAMNPKDRSAVSEALVARRSASDLDFGRLTGVRLNPSTMARLDPLIR